jgi:hypothetical protein
MKKILSGALAVIALSIASCGGQSEDQASNTPIDSTTLNGTAPAEYGPNDPTDPNFGKSQGQADTGVRAGNGTVADSNTQRLP